MFDQLDHSILCTIVIVLAIAVVVLINFLPEE